jgi:hypothetical protein
MIQPVGVERVLFQNLYAGLMESGPADYLACLVL